MKFLKHRFYGASNPAMNVSGKCFHMTDMTECFFLKSTVYSEFAIPGFTCFDLTSITTPFNKPLIFVE